MMEFSTWFVMGDPSDWDKRTKISPERRSPRLAFVFATLATPLPIRTSISTSMPMNVVTTRPGCIGESQGM